MSSVVFPLRIITPQAVVEREATYLRLRDRTGLFGIMRHHAPFVTLLESALGYYRTAADEEVFLAVDGGVVSVAAGAATVASREVFEGSDAAELARRIEETRERRLESERIFSRMVDGLEREFIEKTLTFLRGERP